jgi:hypothetical protein
MEEEIIIRAMKESDLEHILILRNIDSTIDSTSVVITQ